MNNILKKLYCIFLLSLVSLPFITLSPKSVSKVHATNVKADIIDFTFTEGNVVDNSDYNWNILKSATPTFEKVQVSHKGQVYNTTAFKKDFLNDGLTINWKEELTAGLDKKISDGFSMTLAFSIDEFIVSTQDRVLMGNASGGGMNIILEKTNRVAFQMHDGTGYKRLLSKEPLVTNELYYVTSVYDATTKTNKLYINGVLDGEMAVAGFSHSGKKGMSLGGVCDSAEPTGIAFTGYRADNGKYVKSAMYSDILTAAEVKAEYDAFVSTLVAEVKVADILNFDLGTEVTDVAKGAPIIIDGTYQKGTAEFVYNEKTYQLEGYHKNHINQGITVNWSSDEFYTTEFKASMQDGMSMSVAFVLTELYTGERVLFGNASSGGTNIGIDANSKIYSKFHAGNKGYVILTSDEKVKLNTLYYVTVVFDKANAKQKLYVNGVKVAEAVMEALQLSTKKAMSLGGVVGVKEGAVVGIEKTAYRADLGYYFEPRVYSDVLTDQDVLNNFRTFMSGATEVENPKVQVTVDLINAIGEVDETSGEKIQSARNSYDSLNSYEKTKVTNYEKLTEAEFIYKILSRVDATFDENNIVTKVGIVSDTHIGYGGAKEKYIYALNKLVELTGGLDAVLNTGDMTQNGTDSEVQEFKLATESVLDLNTVKYIYAYGNHDTYWSGCMNPSGFKESFGGDYYKFDEDLESAVNGNRHVIVNGIHFLTVQTQTYMPGNNVFSQDTLNWLDQKLKTITTQNPNAFVVVGGHSPVLDTIFGSDSNTEQGHWGANAQLGEIFKKYPQVMYFSGHTHYSVYDDRAIHQDKYTSVLVGSTCDIDIVSGMVEGSALANRRSYSTGLILEFDKDGNARISRYDFVKDAYIKQSWVIPAPKDDNSHLTYYTNFRATQNNAKPVFTEGELVVSKINETTLSVTYPKATDDDMVAEYKISVYNGNNELLKSVKSLSNYYDYPNQADLPSTRTIQVSGISLQKPYTVEVIAYDSWGNASEKITYLVPDTTEEDMAKAKVVDDLIAALGEINAESKEAVENAISKYLELNYEQRTYVENRETLINAINEIDRLYITTTELTNPVKSTDIYNKIPGSAVVKDNAISGVDVVYSSGSYNNPVTIDNPINLNDFNISLRNVKSNNSHFDLCLIFSNIKNDGFDANNNSYPLLLWFDFIVGTIKVYPHVGGTLVVKDDIIKAENFKDTRVDISIKALNDGSYELTFKTFEGVAKGIIPASNVLEVNKITDASNCYAQFSPWNSGCKYSFTILSYGSEEISQDVVKVEDVKNVEVLEHNINSLPAEITKDLEVRINLLKQMYDNLSDYAKTLVNQATLAKLNDAIAKLGSAITLDKPVITIDNNILTIETVENSEGYDIYVNNEYMTTIIETTFDLKTLGLKDGVYEVLVKAYSEEAGESEASDVVTFRINTNSQQDKQTKGCSYGAVYAFLASTLMASTLYVLIKRKK